MDKVAADKAKTKANAVVEEVEAVDAAWKAATEVNKAKTEQTGMTHADVTWRKAASEEHAVIRRGKRSTWPAVTVVAIATGVLSMMMVTTAGAQAVEMARGDGSGYHYGWAEHTDVYDSRGDKVDTIDTIMQRVDLNEIEVQKWQNVETDRFQRLETNNNIEFVSKLGELQLTLDQLGEMKRGDCRAQHTEAAEALRMRADRAEATLQILGELNLNMRSEIEKHRARVDLGRQIQFMRRLLNTERQKEQAAQSMRQSIPEDTGTKQEQQKDLKCGGQQATARQMSWRHKLLMRRLGDDKRQRDGAERELRNLISQVQGHKQERDEHDTVQQREDTMTKSSDQKHKKSHKGQRLVRKHQANEQNSSTKKTVQRRTANSAEETAKVDSSRSHSGSDRDSSRLGKKRCNARQRRGNAN